MVLESLFNPFRVKDKPWQMFIAGFVYAFIGLLLSYVVFREISGILTVFLVVIAALPMFYNTIIYEEKLDTNYTKEWKLLREHTKVLLYLISLFLGVTAALTFIYIFFPQHITGTVFSLQEQAIMNVNNNIHGEILADGLARFDIFIRIILNNFKVLFFSLLFSLLYGTGALFILTWNASVIATAIGNLIKSKIAETVSLVGFPSLIAYFHATTFSFFRYMTHGIFEIAAYFTIGLAGGILSIALIKHDLKNEHVLIDVLDMVLISIGLILLAGIIEVYVTPYFFS